MKINSKNYDYLIVGSGFFGSIWAKEAADQGKRVLVIEKRNHIGGNMYTEKQNGITVHTYGPHIFHTDDKEVWDYVNRFVPFNSYINQVIANYNGELFNLPFNMNTFYQMWKVKTPAEAKKYIEEQKKEIDADKDPANLEEQAIHLIGRDIYHKLIKGYTEKQWGRSAKELPASTIKRLPVRFTFDNNYFNHQYQGIPENGYTELFQKLLDHPLIDVQLNTDFFSDKETYLEEFPKIVYTGMIDQFFDYKFGELDYRSLRFEAERFPTENVQGNAVVNYTDFETPYTRRIEWRHFDKQGDVGVSIITQEYPEEWTKDKEAYYPINNSKNNELANRYLEEARYQEKLIFGGRLGLYRYYDMDQVIRTALDSIKQEFACENEKNMK